jgi:hypothetical protein
MSGLCTIPFGIFACFMHFGENHERVDEDIQMMKQVRYARKRARDLKKDWKDEGDVGSVEN